MLPHKHFLSPGNPLAVIALFVWLTYGVAAVLFGSTAGRLNDVSQCLAMAFIVTFPFAVLRCFFLLVRNHHQKLYAPKDWKDERLLYGPASPTQFGASLRQEVEAPEGASEEADRTDEQSAVEQVEKPPANGKSEAPKPGAGRDRSPVIPQPIKVRPSMAEFALAEALVFLELQAEFNAPVGRHMLVTGQGKPVVDGLINVDGKSYLVEVKRANRKALDAVIRSGASFLERASASLDRARYRPLLAVVLTDQSDLPVSDNIKAMLDKRDIELRVFSLEELVKKYGMAES